MNGIRGLLTDYGGTVDTGGLHWGLLLCSQWQKYIPSLTPAEFFRPYVEAEKRLPGIIAPDTSFRDTLRMKTYLHSDILGDSHSEEVADACYRFALGMAQEARPWLERLADRFPIVLVSNFYGNLETVVSEMGLDGLFSAVIDSAQVDIRKPDPAIWQLGADALGLDPKECIAIGDSEKNDILPARAIGCRTARVLAPGLRSESAADLRDTLPAIAADLLSDQPD